ncbi:MAG: tetratricopeptide repeat protein [Acidobacteriota bacterium]
MDALISVSATTAPVHAAPRRAPMARKGRWLALLVALGSCLACSQATTPAFDTASNLRDLYAEKLPAEKAERVAVPFALEPDLLAELEATVKPAPRETYRLEQVNDFIFRKLDLEYSLRPTRDASGTWRSGEGNCLSFVNLFVAVARQNRLNPFYVEVTDYQRWRHSEGMVLSQGHIVAGMYVKGTLKTFDFLPYEAKSYKDFKPIDDLTASAHYYNNLGAEALIEGDLDESKRHLDTAITLVPTFEKALNNLGVVLARTGDLEGAQRAYQDGLAVDSEYVPILSNLARLYQQQGELEKASAILDQIEDSQTTNPFFFIYRGELALTRGDTAGAIDYMRQALRLDSELPEVHVALAKAFLAVGELDRARHHVERAVRLDATHPEARAMAAMVKQRADA